MSLLVYILKHKKEEKILYYKYLFTVKYTRYIM